MTEKLVTDEKHAKQPRPSPWTNWPSDRAGGNSEDGKYDPASLELKADLVDLIQEARKKHTDKEVVAMGADENSVLVRKGRARSKADALLKPEVQGAMVSYAFGQADLAGMDINRLVTDLEAENRKVADGNMQSVEAMLLSQANALSTIFTVLSRKAQANMGHFMGATDTYLRLAFKAQAQCRATLETLSEIKNPRQATFVRQANIANGPQQVNNGPTQQSSLARAEESEFPPSKLLEHHDGERLDFGTASAAGRARQDLETVGEVYGAENRGGQGQDRRERFQRRDAADPSEVGSSDERAEAALRVGGNGRERAGGE